MFVPDDVFSFVCPSDLYCNTENRAHCMHDIDFEFCMCSNGCFFSIACYNLEGFVLVPQQCDKFYGGLTACWPPNECFHFLYKSKPPVFV